MGEHTRAFNSRSLYAAVHTECVLRGISLRQAAKEAGVMPSTFSNLKRGQSVSADTYIRIQQWRLDGDHPFDHGADWRSMTREEIKKLRDAVIAYLDDTEPDKEHPMSDLYAPIIEDIGLVMAERVVGTAASDYIAAADDLREALAPHLQRAWANGRNTGHLDARQGKDTRRNPYTLEATPAASADDTNEEAPSSGHRPGIGLFQCADPDKLKAWHDQYNAARAEEEPQGDDQ